VREIIIPEDFKCVLPHHHTHNPCILHRFRLFVVGKVRPAALRQALTGIDLGSPAQRKSGKSSLIKAVFKVDVTVRFHTSVILRRRHDRTMKTRPETRMRNPASMPSFVQKITVTSSSMSLQDLNLRPEIRKTCGGPSGTSFHIALIQVVRVQKGCTPSGK
jgi:hypothetical protein